MISALRRYTHWLHTRWPAGTVEKLPEVRADGTTAVPGVYVVGDLTGIPLLKFSCDSGARAVDAIAADPEFAKLRGERPEAGREMHDLVIVGGGVAGMAAALEAKKHGLSFQIVEASEPFSTVVNFPKRKPIFTYPTEMRPAGELQVSAQVKEELVAELRAQTLEQGIAPLMAHVDRIERQGKWLEVVTKSEQGDEERLLARRVIIAIGRSGNFRKLGVPGEELDKVSNRLHDPADYADKDVLIVGGGDSALETAIAIAQCGGRVTLSYRKPEFARPKPENVERLKALMADPLADVAIENPVSERVTAAAGAFLGERRKAGGIQLALASRVKSIGEREVVLVDATKAEQKLPNDAVFAMIGREPPLEFFRRSGIPIQGEWRTSTKLSFAAFLLLCLFLYNWKSSGWLNQQFQSHGWFPFNMTSLAHGLSEAAKDSSTLAGTLAITLGEPGFYYATAYCLCVGLFGIARIRRRKTPYVTAQTLTLIAFQFVPLFLLPYVLLPYLGHNGVFDGGFGQGFADALFPMTGDGQGREYWRAFGFVLAWPLFIWNVFTEQPLWAWLAISLVQTFVIIPLIIWRWGKGAYCGWVCSCGALAETLGDTQRQKMPHGPLWNRLNMVGQVLLAVCFLIFLLRILGWAGVGFASRAAGAIVGGALWGLELNYYHIVDIGLAGIVGVGLYFWFSGRVWCRFACPLAALMHIYARFTSFRILADKKKCISCNVCTRVCHQGIDIMSFANKGLPMADPECVRCSACVQNCPTGVLEFGRIDAKSGREIERDKLVASRVRSSERALAGH